MSEPDCANCGHPEIWHGVEVGDKVVKCEGDTLYYPAHCSCPGYKPAPRTGEGG